MSNLENQPRIVVCGLSPIGANAIDALVRRGFQNICAVDGELVSEYDVMLPPFGWSDIGSYRTKAISRCVYRATGHRLDVVGFSPTETNVETLIDEPFVCVNAFENGGARETVSTFCESADIPCLHVAATIDRFDLFWASQSDSELNPAGVTEQWVAAAFVASTVERFVTSGSYDVSHLKVA